MTLNDIGRMLQLANVPRSKTVECMYPHPCIVIHVPAHKLFHVSEIVKRLVMFGQDIQVTLLESRDVGEGEHVYVKMKGDNRVIFTDAPADYRRRKFRDAQIIANRAVTIECASVVR